MNKNGPFSPRHSLDALAGVLQEPAQSCGQGRPSLSRFVAANQSLLFCLFLITATLQAASQDAYKNDIEPILIEFCYDCHGDGSEKGNVALDQIMSHPAPRDVWYRVLKNLRAGLMPPTGKPHPSPAQAKSLTHWIKYTALGIDPANPDPGQVGIRRLNRTEYQNTIRDLMGIEFRAYEEFPPDDSGYGFDNIGSVLTLSPLLMEKYLQAAEAIVAQAFPLKTRVPAQLSFRGHDLIDPRTNRHAARIPFDDHRRVEREISIKTAGRYQIHLKVEVDGAFTFAPGKSRMTVRLAGADLKVEEYAWKPSDVYDYTFEIDWQPGSHRFELELEPTAPTENENERIHLEVHQLLIEGPMATQHWVKPPRFDRFYTRDTIPTSPADQDAYAVELIQTFADKAFRRPARQSTIRRLVAIAQDTYRQPGKGFQEGIARALVAILTSPRFLLKIDDIEERTHSDGTHPRVDPFSLASRLSYFLWSSTPDQELLDLAKAGRLQAQLPMQWRRLLNDPKADAFIENFVGQWLQARDVSGVSINARAVFARENAEDPQLAAQRERYFTLRRKREETLTDAEVKELSQLRAIRRTFFTRPKAELTGSLRNAMRLESEKTFEYIVRNDRSVLELLDSNYTFLNSTLARHYGIEGVEGNHFRRVELPPDHPRGGILTHGTTLTVTSNPTRTSPVKRGLFILENILGTPPPPPPADVPDLDSATTSDHEPTLREALAQHRESPLCRSCHNRMDPLGLSLENFNALGMWRDQELGQSIDPTGTLITGEHFDNISDLKQILVNERRTDFYRCLTEKLLTYALGRGLEPYDVEAVDQIVSQLEDQSGRFSVLLKGIVLSTPFQRTQSRTPRPENKNVAQHSISTNTPVTP